MAPGLLAISHLYLHTHVSPATSLRKRPGTDVQHCLCNCKYHVMRPSQNDATHSEALTFVLL
jgi:hypothetical protein